MPTTRLNQDKRYALLSFARDKYTPDAKAEEELRSKRHAVLSRLVNSLIKHNVLPQEDVRVLVKYKHARSLYSLLTGYKDNRILRIKRNDHSGNFRTFTEIFSLDEINEFLESNPLSVSHCNFAYIYDESPDAWRQYHHLDVGEGTFNALKEYEQAKRDFDQKCRDERSSFTKLIEGSRTFEQVVDAWPQAEEMRAKICTPNTSLVVLSEQDRSTIKSVTSRSSEAV